MKKISLLFAVILLLCSSCNQIPAHLESENSLSESTSITSESINNSEPISESESLIESESVIESMSSAESESESESEKESETPKESESEKESTSASSNNDSIPASGQTLPIGNGNKTVTGPNNLSRPDNIGNWINYDLSESLPAYFSYIQGNNKLKNCNDFYALSAGGGFKYAQLYYGLQTPVFTPYKKVEVRLRISAVKNNSQKKDEGEPIMHIYGYNSSGKYIYQSFIEQGAIDGKSVGKEVKFYIRDMNVYYFELRLNAFPYKSSQCYNFGVDQISLKGWDYE